MVILGFVVASITINYRRPAGMGVDLEIRGDVGGHPGVLAMSGRGIRKTFTVRRIVQGEGVERIFPLHSPTIAGIEVVRRGHVRRAKLYYLRELSGKSARIKEKL